MSKIKVPTDDKKCRYYLYALQLEQGRYYIGITANIRKRLWQHYSGSGARFTKVYKPVKTLGVLDLGVTTRALANAEEMVYTMKAVRKYGALCVRGAGYSQTIMPLDKLKRMQKRAEGYS
jgi:predicted GIY-YIG superfamily endonuclease